jgi:excisionase family DNA binding protein
MQYTVPRSALSISETAAALGIGRTTVYKLVRDRRLPLAKIGRRSVIPAAALASFVASLSEGTAA